MRDVGFAQAYSFKYSARPGTPAADMDGHIAEQIKSARLQTLQDEINRQQIAFNESCVGRVLPILFDRMGARPGQLIGRSPFMQAVHAELSADYFGETVPIMIERAKPNSLSGRPVGDLKQEAVA